MTLALTPRTQVQAQQAQTEPGNACRSPPEWLHPVRRNASVRRESCTQVASIVSTELCVLEEFTAGSKHWVPELHSVVESYFAAPIDPRIAGGRPPRTTGKGTVAVGRWSQLAYTQEAQVC